MKTILVTGGAGFVGRHACKALITACMSGGREPGSRASMSVTNAVSCDGAGNTGRSAAGICVSTRSRLKSG